MFDVSFGIERSAVDAPPELVFDSATIAQQTDCHYNDMDKGSYLLESTPIITREVFGTHEMLSQSTQYLQEKLTKVCLRFDCLAFFL